MSERRFRRANERRVEDEAKPGHGRAVKLAAGAGAALGATVLFAPAADAATFTVTNTDDAGPGSLNVRRCSTRMLPRALTRSPSSRGSAARSR